MVARPVADRLLGLLHEYVADLRGLQGLSYAQYTADVRTRRFAERTLHIAIEACLDLGHHIIAEEGYREPQDNKDVFRVLGEQGLLPEDLASDLMKMASFRNLLVHAYGTIDDALVFGLVQRRLGDLEQFTSALLRYLRPTN